METINKNTDIAGMDYMPSMEEIGDFDFSNDTLSINEDIKNEDLMFMLQNDIEKEITDFINKKQYTIENLFIEIAQTEHTDRYDLAQDIHNTLMSHGIIKFDYARVVNDITTMIYNVENKKLKRLHDIAWLKDYNVINTKGCLKLICIKQPTEVIL
jgi:hypothetical protein